MDPAVIAQIFGTISQSASSGAQASGTIASYLIGLGYSAAAISQILNGVAGSANASPEIIAYAQQEMMYAQQAYEAEQRKKMMLWALGGLAALWLLNRNN